MTIENEWQKRIDASFLMASSPEAVYQHIKEIRNSEEDEPLWPSKYSWALERILVSKNEPLINLGIAQYGGCPNVIRKLFISGNSGIRCACLRNKIVGPVDENPFQVSQEPPFDWKLAIPREEGTCR